MGSIINLQTYMTARTASMLVLVDFQQEHLKRSDRSATETAQALANCTLALAHARALDLPIAFVRWIDHSPFNAGNRFSRWIEGFEPTGVDMVFEREGASCYAAPNFDEVVGRAGGRFAFAGFASESSCLATAMDASNNGHRVTYLSDASVSHQLGEIAARDVHRVVAEIIGQYGEQMPTERWMQATTPPETSDRQNRGRARE